MATATSTVRTVPDWAEEYVILYAERSMELSGALGGQRMPPATAADVSGSNVNVGSAIDGSSTTYAQIISDNSTATNGVAIYSGFSAGTEAYTRLRLQVSVAFNTGGHTGNTGVTGTLYYSLDGGGTWVQFYYAASPDNDVLDHPREIKEIELSLTQDLTLVQLKAVAKGEDGADAYLEIYEVWISGNFPLEEGSAGSLQAYAGPIFAAQNQDEIDGIDGLATRGRYGDQVISKAIAYEDDVINGGHLAGAKAGFVAALASVTGNSTSDFASIYSRIGRKPYYVGDSDSSYLAQTFVTNTAATYNARASALIYNDNYQKERAIQDNALGYGVEMGKHAAIDAETLRRAGLMQREYVQYGYVMSHKLFIEEMEMNVVNLEVFGNCLRALTGSQQTTTQEYSGGNKMTAAVGMGMAGGVVGWYAGAYLGGTAGSWGGPIGAAVGFVAGAVLGYVLS